MVSRVLTSAPRNGLNQTDSYKTPEQLSLRLITKSEVDAQSDKAQPPPSDTEKRSQAERIADNSNVKCMFVQGVGGRPATPAPRPGGGGYLDICTTFQAPLGRDPRLDSLRRMGLHHTWQRVAATIGVDAFLEMWRILDSEEQFAHEGDGLRVSLRRYRSYQRFERDDFIRTLHENGSSITVIQKRLLEQFGESLSTSGIQYILGGKITK